VSDDLIERLEFVARGLDSQWDKEIADIMMEAAAEIRTLRAECDDRKRLHAENCALFDKACAEREWLRDQAVDRAARRAARDAGLAEGVALGIEAAAVAVIGYIHPDYPRLPGQPFASAQVRNLDPAAIVREQAIKDDKFAESFKAVRGTVDQDLDLEF